MIWIDVDTAIEMMEEMMEEDETKNTITTLDELENEYTKYIKGNTLAEYLKISRIGETIKLNRKERKELYVSVKKMQYMPLWDSFFFPVKGPVKSTFSNKAYYFENKILER